MQSRKAIVSAAAFVVTGLALVGCESSTATSSGEDESSSGTVASGRMEPYQTGTYQDNPADYSNTSPETPGVARPAGGRIEREPAIESQPGTMDNLGGPGSSARPSQPTDGNVYSSPSDSSRGSMRQGQDINAQPAGAAIPGSVTTQPSPMTTQPSRQSTGSQSSSLNRDSTSGSGRSGQMDTSAQPAGSAISGSSTTRPAQQSQQGQSGSSSWEPLGQSSQSSGSGSMDQTTGQPAGSALPGQSGMPATRATTQPSGMSPRSSSGTWGSTPDHGTSPGASSSSDDLSGGSLAQPAGSGVSGSSTTQPSQQ